MQALQRELFTFVAAILISFANQGFCERMEIVTIDSPLKEVLQTKTEDIQEDEFELALEIAEKLFLSLQPYFPAAGLAAPQIGISKSVFIFSFDRTPENLEIVINPSFTPVTDVKVEGWECCFSVLLSDGIWKIAKVPHYEAIKVSYLNTKKEIVEKTLEGFASQVFQHEYNHLQGIVNITREDAEVLEFDSKETLLKFMETIKKRDSKSYKNP